MFGEIAHFLLACSVNDQNSGFSTVITQIGCVPTELEVNVQHQFLFVGVGHAVGPQHGALVDDDVGGGGGALAAFERPLNAHGIASLVAGQHDLHRGQVGTAVGLGDFHVQFVRLGRMEPGLTPVGPSKSIGFDVRSTVNGQLVHEQLLTVLIAATVLQSVARGVGSLEVDGHLLSQAAGRVVHHEGVDAGQGCQITWNQHRHGVVFTCIRPPVEVGVVDPFLPHHGGHGIRKDRLVSDGDLNHLCRTGRAVVVSVHGGLHDAGLDRIHGEGAAERCGLDDAGPVKGREAHLPGHFAVRERNGFGEIPIRTVQHRGVSHR